MARNGKQPDHSNEPSLLGFEHGQTEKQADEEILTVGDRLRMAREERGLSLHQVAGILRLKATQVQALEDGDYSRLPGQTFVTGFLRSYANLLDLDAVLMVDLYKQEHSGGLRTPSLAFPEPSSEGRMPGKGIMVGTLMLALVFTAGWFVYQESGGQDFERVAELPDYLAKKIEKLPEAATESAVIAKDQTTTAVNPDETTNSSDTAESTVSETASRPELNPETAAEPVEAAETVEIEVSEQPKQVETTVVEPEKQEMQPTEAVQEPVQTVQAPEKAPEAEKVVVETEKTPVAEEAPVESVSSEETVAVATVAIETQQPDAVQPASYPQAKLEPMKTLVEEEQESPLPRTFGVENTDARVVLRAREETWVEVKSADSPPYISQVLKPGDIYMAPNVSDVTLTTGNAGALEVRVDGTEISSLGANGAILRDISLVADNLLDGSTLN
ncbi:MAG: DUF4115 domain-containing protein [Proteobacteria bacterium]|nr:DUF4115 domain-containing protein [Pseudomonadota bacterium]